MARRYKGSARRLIFAALALASALLFLFPGVSEAHAILVRSDPAPDAKLSAPPAQVRMWFTENLNPTFSTAIVVNANSKVSDIKSNTGLHADQGDVHVSANDSKEMDVSLKPNLPPAVYVVLYRTQSADDGHVLNGSFIFTVTNPDGSVPTYNGTLPSSSALGGGSATGSSSGQLDGPGLFTFIMTTLVDLGAVFWVGAQLFYTFVIEMTENADQEQRVIYQRAQQRFERNFSLPALLVILLANIGVLVGQALAITAGSFSQAFNPSILGGLVANGHFGTYWTVRQVVTLVAIVLAIYALLVKWRSQLMQMVLPWANLLLGLALLIAITFSGHAAAVSSNALTLSVLSDWTHLLAASLWIGGMMYISLIYLPILHRSTPLERTRSLLGTLPNYSPLAYAGVAFMAITGPFNATVHMDSWQQLLTTAYGRALDVKVLLVAAMVITSAIHVFSMRPRLARNYKQYSTAADTLRPSAEAEESQQTQAEQEAYEGQVVTAQAIKQLEGQIVRQTQRLSTVLRWEPLLGVGVLICTGLLTVFAGTLQPAVSQQSQQSQQLPTATTVVKPFVTTAQTSDKQYTVKVSVSPNRLGNNVFTATVLNSKGVVDTNVGVSLYTTMLDMDMGTDSINLQPDGKGNFSASGDLNMSGNWAIRVEVRTPDFKLHEAQVKFFTPF